MRTRCGLTNPATRSGGDIQARWRRVRNAGISWLTLVRMPRWSVYISGRVGCRRFWVSRDAVGLTPKRRSQLWRLQRLSALARRTRTPDWAQLAHTCGYYDQSHLIGDVQEFTGTSPGQMIRSSQRVMDHHLALPEEVK